MLLLTIFRILVIVFLEHFKEKMDGRSAWFWKSILTAKKRYIYSCASQIIVGIATNRLKEGESLPSVRQLAESIGINMHTVNKAYTVLKQEGFVKVDRRRAQWLRLMRIESVIWSRCGSRCGSFWHGQVVGIFPRGSTCFDRWDLWRVWRTYNRCSTTKF